MDNKEDDYGVPRFLSMSPRHTLPEKVLIGYASQDFDAVRKAVHSGTNVVVWAFAEFLHDDSSSKDGIVSLSDHRRAKTRQFARLETNLDLDGIQRLIDNLNFEGYDHVIHMVSFGGWNSAHLDPKLGSFAWYIAFRETLGQVFHGIDWDLEGKDELSSPDNLFTTACLRKMGEISQLAHNGKNAKNASVSALCLVLLNVVVVSH